MSIDDVTDGDDETPRPLIEKIRDIEISLADESVDADPYFARLPENWSKADSLASIAVSMKRVADNLCALTTLFIALAEHDATKTGEKTDG